MEEHIVKIYHTEYVTHDVKRFTVDRPEGYFFKSGQATEVSVNKPEWKDKKHPFTFTSLNDWKELEFTIKIFPEHHGVTDQLSKLTVGDEVIIHDVWGAISYKGKGVFIAGGAGITPFISIFRQLKKDENLPGHKLIFSNKTEKDIILKKEFEGMLGENFINVITDEKSSNYHNGRIDKDYLKNNIQEFNQNFYICGPDRFTEAVNGMLTELGAKPDMVVFEK